MEHDNTVTTARCLAIFVEEISAAGGTVSVSLDNGRSLIARSVLPRAGDVRPNDRVQGGVAIRASLPRIWVAPYVLRQICTNGVILPLSVRSRQIEINAIPEFVDSRLREAIRACGSDDTFEES